MSFDAFYKNYYGERWPALREALAQPVQHVAWLNPFSDAAPPEGEERAELPHCRFGPSFPPPPEDPPRPYYLLDPASVLAARSLEVQPGDTVIDLCAAPGGKTLELCRTLGEGSLLANERSDARRGRLARVLDTYLPPALRSRVRVTGHDATRWCLHARDACDRILLDAPCSGERHLLAEGLGDWTPSRSRQLAVRQHAMLASALQVVRPGGRIVYSTCSISPLENDGVVAQAIKKRPCHVLRPALPWAEPTAHGAMLLPDRSGFGPMYIAVLERPV